MLHPSAPWLGEERKASPHRYGKSQQELGRILLARDQQEEGCSLTEGELGAKGIPPEQCKQDKQMIPDDPRSEGSMEGGSQGGSQPLESGPTVTRQAHTDKRQPRSSQEVSPGDMN